ncbi:uncharacterized protein FSUBG_424 [Fusarium subglutinans]|uniref:Uncharacterized protein n=1 Tax=Gibberella subglutinans TaxID=42677 RepID=A0A8H5QEI9_GIBSU|nr:uncharacterized protein FSUBG_424 [Fusarium subglutinans]KAF5613812.1 hypothetical protein FSUBG_424 [Fusarium subglutinans]
MSDLNPLAATFELRYKKAWKLCYEGNREEAETTAAELLLEPRLGRFHQAGMHLLLAMSPHDYVEHALEAVKLYTEMENREGVTVTEREQLQKLIGDANHLLNKARQDQTVADRNIQKVLATMTMDDLHDARIEEMHKRLDAEQAAEEAAAAAVAEDLDDAFGVAPSQELPSSQDVPELAGDSQMTGTDTQRTDSQRITVSRSVSIADSQRTETGLDDDEPLPDIVRYKFDDKKGL